MGSNLLSLARDLHRRRARRRRKLALVEGWRLVADALDAGVTFRGVLVSEGAGSRPADAALLQKLADHAIASETVADHDLAGVATTETPQGIVAVVEAPGWHLADLQPARGSPILVIDAVQDPGNLGALLRTAYAMGAAGAVLLPGCAEPGNPRVIRGAMGASFRLPVAQMRADEFAAWARQLGLAVWAASADGTAVERAPVHAPVALIIGNEGIGVKAELRALADKIVAVPLARGAESLNVAVAAGILLYEVRRD